MPLVDDILSYAGRRLPAVLEIGPGRGEATEAFAGRGAAVTCVEPNPASAGALRIRVPAAAVAECEFERWRPPSLDAFDIVYSGQSWHLLDPAVRLTALGRVLRPGGTLALSWNRIANLDDPVRLALVAVHRERGLERLAAALLDDPDRPAQDGPCWREIIACGRFAGHTTHAFPARCRMSADAYLRAVRSQPGCRRLDTVERDALLGELAEVLAAHGGTLDLEVVTDLYLATWRPS